MPEKKKSAGRPKQNYTLSEAAEYLGWKEADVLRNYYRGLEPGKSSTKDSKGVRVWKGDALKKAKSAQEARSGVSESSPSLDTATP